jgi:hypothetical protein
LRQDIFPMNAADSPIVPGAIAIPVPDPNSRSLSEISLQQSTIPPYFDSSSSVSSEGRLPVPDRNIPLGRGGYVPAPLGGNSLPDSRESSPSFDRPSALGLRYRVVVDTDRPGDRQKMQSLIPGAFREREKAEELLQMLTFNGLDARIEEIK